MEGDNESCWAEVITQSSSPHVVQPLQTAPQLASGYCDRQVPGCQGICRTMPSAGCSGVNLTLWEVLPLPSHACSPRSQPLSRWLASVRSLRLLQTLNGFLRRCLQVLSSFPPDRATDQVTVCSLYRCIRFEAIVKLNLNN